jgi:hypothetical protein
LSRTTIARQRHSAVVDLTGVRNQRKRAAVAIEPQCVHAVKRFPQLARCYGVRLDERLDGIYFCDSCWERTWPPGPDDELGVAG